MNVVFQPRAWTEYQHFVTHDPAGLKRLNSLLGECFRAPFTGRGKPEPLKGELRGWWSRRVTQEDRLVYRVSGTGSGQQLEVLQCRSHY